jgi:hypothetical protein
MLLRVDRIESDEESTLGRLFIDGQFECWTLEDRYRQGAKVHGKTRIPSGRYRIQMRREGGFHTNYLARYKEPWHQGMLHVRDVPGFEYILIHVGNSHDDTEGCLLVGKGKTLVEGHHYVTESRGAYEALYPKVRDALLAGQSVEIEYRDLDPASQPMAPEPAVAANTSTAASGKDHTGAVAGATGAAGATVAVVGGALMMEGGDEAPVDGVVDDAAPPATEAPVSEAAVDAGAPVEPAPADGLAAEGTDAAGVEEAPPVEGGEAPADAAVDPGAPVEGAAPPVEAPVEPPVPEPATDAVSEAAVEGGDPESAFFDDVVARASDPDNLLEVVLIVLGVIVVICAVYFLIRRFSRK